MSGVLDGDADKDPDVRFCRLMLERVPEDREVMTRRSREHT
jgi:hypothetical protein